jgi:hypothetical protein
MEKYFSWSRRSTLTFDRGDYFAFHSQGIQIAVAAGLAALFSVACLWILRTPRVARSSRHERTALD